MSASAHANLSTPTTRCVDAPPPTRDGTAPPDLFRFGPPDGPDDLLVVRGSLARRGPLRLRIVGELCAYSAPSFARFLEDRVADRDLVIDTSAVTFVDSAGIRALVALGATWTRRGRSVVVADPSEVMCRLVGILRLEETLFGAPTATGSTPAVAPVSADIDVRNLDRGQTIEVVAVGPVVGEMLQSLARRLELLAAKRQPATLRLDLTDATVDVGAADLIASVATTLDEFGSRLVVVGAGPLEAAVPASRLGRSLAFAERPVAN